MVSRYHPPPVHSDSAPARCLGSTVQTHRDMHTCGLYLSIHSYVLGGIMGGRE